VAVVLIRGLPSELDSLRAATQTAQHESATAAHQTAAMMSLNLKLQSSAAKNQARAVELEIKKLEARERGELLGIVQVGFLSFMLINNRLNSELFSLTCPNSTSSLIATPLIAISSSHVWRTKLILSTLSWDRLMAYPSRSTVSCQKCSSEYVKCVSLFLAPAPVTFNLTHDRCAVVPRPSQRSANGFLPSSGDATPLRSLISGAYTLRSLRWRSASICILTFSVGMSLGRWNLLLTCSSAFGPHSPTTFFSSPCQRTINAYH